MTENVTGYGSNLAYGAATGASLPAFGSDTYTVIPDLEEITPPAGSRQVEEYYVLDQKASKKLVGSLTFDAAQGTAVRAFDSAAQQQMMDDANAAVAVRRNWRIGLPNTGTELHYFAGYMSKFAYAGLNNQGRVQYNWEITVDGAVTVVP
jgi:hypothetical protein